MASAHRKERQPRSRKQAPWRSRQTTKIFQRQMRMNEKEIKRTGTPRAYGQQEFTVRPQDTSTGPTGIWMPNEERLQTQTRGTVR